MDFWIHLKIWLSGGKLPDSAKLFGMSLIWWVRLAKMLQFVSGSVILAELVGFDRLRAGGERIKNLIVWQSILTLPTSFQVGLKIGLLGLSESVLELLAASHPIDSPLAETSLEGPVGEQLTKLETERRDLQNAKGTQKVHRVLGALGVILYLFMAWRLRHLFSLRLGWPIVFVLLPIVYYLTIMLFLVMAALLLKLPVAILEFVILEPLGRVLSNPRLKSFVLAGSYVILLVGFLIDLITS